MANPVASIRFSLPRLSAAALCVALVACTGPWGDVARETGTSSSSLSPPARTFLSTLNTRERAVAVFPFDNPARLRWAYVPQARAGMPLRAMDSTQRVAAFALLGTGLSTHGMGLARGVFELEGMLGRIEGAVMSTLLGRDPEMYRLALFAGPDGAGPWGWRFEGHHLSVNVTELGAHGRIVAPLFVGANPARVASGPKAGHRLLAAEEDLAFELLNMLDPAGRARATISAETFGEIVTRMDPTVKPMALEGMPAAEMTPAAQGALRRLLGVYAGRMADSAAAAQLGRIEAAGFGRLHFAWAGSHERGTPHYYRIHGPTVLVEYDNTQGNANHVHCVWRDLENDFGGDLLRQHYARHVHRD